jgi:hypothetical protein
LVRHCTQAGTLVLQTAVEPLQTPILVVEQTPQAPDA